MSETQRWYLGIPDDEFEQRKPKRGLLTKQEVRVVSLAKLRLQPGHVVWDIGTGSGSVSIEAARFAASVYTIEKNEEDFGIASRNLARFGATNVTIIHGKAPEHIDQWPDPDAVFIGGSSGSMADLVLIAGRRLRPGGRVVVNAATFENLQEARSAMAELGMNVDVVQLSAARSKPILNLTRLEAFDPVFIVSGDFDPRPAGEEA